MVTITPAPLTLTRELPGRTSAFRVAEVRARVNGIVQKRLFAEGSDVKEGQKLFLIDPAPYEAALDGARAALARAEATLANARVQAAAPRRAHQDQRREPAGPRQRHGRPEDGGGRRRRGARRRADGPDQPRLHDRDGAGVRPHRPLGGDRGGLRPGVPGHPARHRPADRPDLRGPDPVGRRGAAAAARPRDAASSRGPARDRPGCGSSPTTAASTPSAGTLQFTDVTVDPGTGLDHAARALPQPEGRAPARHVRARPARRGGEPRGAAGARRWASPATRRGCPWRWS